MSLYTLKSDKNNEITKKKKMGISFFSLNPTTSSLAKSEFELSVLFLIHKVLFFYI